VHRQPEAKKKVLIICIYINKYVTHGSRIHPIDNFHSDSHLSDRR